MEKELGAQKSSNGICRAFVITKISRCIDSDPNAPFFCALNPDPAAAKTSFEPKSNGKDRGLPEGRWLPETFHAVDLFCFS